MAHLYLSAPQKSSGKTTLSIGLCRVLAARGLRVQPFKKGPDYIDPLWLTQAAGRACLNLDFHTMGRDEITAAFAAALETADLGVIEGNVGLFDDSSDPTGATSNAALARQLRAPVVLVVNCQGLARGIAPLLLGYRAFDPELWLAGVILNRVGGGRHLRTLVQAVEAHTDLPVLGALQRDDALTIAERHLGLMPSNETAGAADWIAAIAGRVADQVDVDRLLALAGQAPRPDPVPAPVPEGPDRPGAGLRIGIARDAAFGFYYPDDLRDLEAAGATLVPFSPLADATLPAVDALLIGGGFPECRMAELEANRTLRAAIADFIAGGGPVHAECGGLMYLCQGLRWGEERRAMVGALAAEVEMRPRPQGRGYVRLRETPDFPWPRLPEQPEEIRAHEFHHSAVVTPAPDWRYGYRVLRGAGIDGVHDGIVQGNLLACYSHLRAVGGNAWTRRFLLHIQRCRGA